MIEAGIDLDVIYIASPELFDRLPDEEREELFNDDVAATAMGITGFTRPTMYRWIRSDLGLTHTLHPFVKGHYLGSGPGDWMETVRCAQSRRGCRQAEDVTRA